MNGYVHDPRHRYSYELRPDGDLDQAIRDLAAQLEADGLLAAGASTAPRFQPHLTLLRADHADVDLVEQVAAHVAEAPRIELASMGAFGVGRIAWLAPAAPSLLARARRDLIDGLGEQHVDPLALARSPWVPHVTVAYEVDVPHREQVQARLHEALPLSGRWRVAQAWDLDVRPTTCVVESPIDA